MKHEIQIASNESEAQNVPVRLSRRGKVVLKAVGIGMAAGAAVGSAAAMNAANTPEFHGEHQVTITEDNVTDIAMDNVKGADNDIRATVDEIVAKNPKVFQDGKAFVESQDVGKTIEVPDSVDK